MSAMTVTNNGHNLYRDGSKGAANSIIKYVAIGSGTMSPTTADAALQNETMRKAITSFTNGTNPGELLVNVYIAPGEAVGFDIEEVGLFGSTSATSMANSGVLIARGLYSHPNKTNLESIQFQIDLQF